MNCSLSTIEKLCEIYNHPQRAFATIHVAGTNGKGSVCTKIAASLHQEGYTTGLYTSPHIATFRERIQVENVMISEEEIVSLFHAVNAKIAEEGIVATFFELTTLLAFLYFRLKKSRYRCDRNRSGGAMGRDEYPLSPPFGDHLDRLRPHRYFRHISRRDHP